VPGTALGPPGRARPIVTFSGRSARSTACPGASPGTARALTVAAKSATSTAASPSPTDRTTPLRKVIEPMKPAT